jgi:predicted nucleotide-binding protein
MGSVHLRRPVDEVSARILEAIAAGGEILAMQPLGEQPIAEFRERYLGWEARVSAMLDAAFEKSGGFMVSGPKEEFAATALSLLDLKISGTSIPAARVPEVQSDVREKMRVLRSIVERLDLYAPMEVEPAARSFAAGAPIFLVHGHDLARREVVRRFLETVTDRAVLVLADQPNKGHDLLGKLLGNAQSACFAVVLLTADDIGGPAASPTKPRARQNVVFELGLFIGMLGRDRVAALYEPDVEIPTDFSGVAYIAVQGESWQVELARELKAAGIEVSLDRAL